MRSVMLAAEKTLETCGTGRSPGEPPGSSARS
jgi:hypothetical protein